MDKIIEFKCTPEKTVYNSDNFKIYGCYVNGFDYPDVKINKYGNATIKGDISELNLGVEYIVNAKEISDSYGVSYEVMNIKREKPTSLMSTKTFLYEIITPRQAESLLSVYPDIVNKVINNDLDDIDLSKVKGIKDYTFDVIKIKIIENFKLADLVEEFKGLFSLQIIKKIYEKYTSVDKVKEVIREDPYKCLCSLGGIGFKTADALLLKLNDNSKESLENGTNPVLYFSFDLIKSYQRAKACVLFLLDENENSGNTYMDIRELKTKFDILVPEAKENLPMILKGDEDVFFDRDSLTVSKAKTYEIEKHIAEKINEALKSNVKWDLDCSQFRKLDGFDLTEEQSKTSEYMCNNNLTLLIGYGGSGKSSSTKAFINMLKHYNKSFLLLAPTGKAAKVLKKYTNEDAYTIHCGLGYMPPNRWGYNEENKLDFDVVIIDEFSMVDIFLFKHLIDAIDFSKTKLLLIGDDAQIPSVGAGNVLYDLIQYENIPKITLTKIFRYGKGGLSTVATDTRNGDKYLADETNIQIFGEDKSYVYMPVVQDKMVDYSVELYKKLLNKGYNFEDIAVISCYNVGDYGTNVINKRIQSAINPNTDKKITFGDTEYRLNDIVMNYVNDYKAIIYDCNYNSHMPNTTFIANGESGRIIEVLWDGIVVDYDGIKIYIPKGSMKNIKLAYAMSCHKVQGSQYKVVVLLTPKAHTFMLNSNLLYVGISRAKEQCYHLGEIKTINNALKKKENFDRKTMLLNFLKADN